MRFACLADLYLEREVYILGYAPVCAYGLTPGACSLPPSTRRVSHARAVTRSLRPLRYRHKRAFGRALARLIPPQRRASTYACRTAHSPKARKRDLVGCKRRVTAASRTGIGHCFGYHTTKG